MTIESAVNAGITYSGNDSTTVFSFPFKVNLTSQVEVVIRDSLGVETTKTVDVDYTVTNQNIEGSGSLTYPISGDPLATGDKITITPKMDYKQPTDIRNQGRFAPQSHEDAFDTAMMHIKELKGLVDRAVKFKKSSEIIDAEFGEDPVDNRILTWDGTTGKIKNTSASSIDVALVSSFWEAVLVNTDLSDSLDSLGVPAYIQTLLAATTAAIARGTLDAEQIINSLTAVTTLEEADQIGFSDSGDSNNSKKITIANLRNTLESSKTTKGFTLLDNQITHNNNSTDANNDVDCSAGVFEFDDGTGKAIATAMTKQLDAAWAAGDDAGGLDTGSKASGTIYHIHAIWNPTSSLSDFLFSLSATAPTMPSGYTKSTWLGSILTDGSGNIHDDSYYYHLVTNDGQFVINQLGTVGTTTTTVPFDDSKPQNTEGGEFMNLKITPKKVGSVIRAKHVGLYECSITARTICAMFKDSVADALKVSRCGNISAQGTAAPITIEHAEISTALTEINFKIRAGGDSASTITFNGTGGVRRFGGVSNSVLILTESKV